MLAITLTSIQLPLVLAALVVGTGALVVFFIRRGLGDIELACLAYVFVMIVIISVSLAAANQSAAGTKRLASLILIGDAAVRGARCAL